jgi:hypothetical protein
MEKYIIITEFGEQQDIVTTQHPYRKLLVNKA